MALIKDMMMKEGRDYPVGGKIGDPMPTNKKLGGVAGPSGPASTTAQSASSPATFASPTVAPQPVGYAAEKSSLGDGDTVEGRLGRIVNSGSPLIEDARTRAAQAMNKRGLINSSMAVGEGEKAAYSVALPIAQQDAAASLTLNRDNTQSENQARQFGATAENTFSQQNLQGQQAMEQIKERGAQETGLQEMRGNQTMQLSTLENQYKQLLQTNQSAALTFSNFSTAIGEILKEPGIGVEQKNQLVQKQIELLRNAMTVIGGVANLDLSSLLNFPEPAPPTPPAPTPTDSIGMDSNGNYIGS